MFGVTNDENWYGEGHGYLDRLITNLIDNSCIYRDNDHRVKYLSRAATSSLSRTDDLHSNMAEDGSRSMAEIVLDGVRAIRPCT